MADPHVVSALVRKRAEMAGEVQAVEKRAAQLRADLVHLDAVLRMFDAAAEPGEIAPKRPYRRRRQWFSDGEMPRRILDALRASSEPLSASEIGERVMTRKGLDTGDSATFIMIRKCVQSYLRRQDGAGRGGGAEGAGWVVAGGRIKGYAGLPNVLEWRPFRIYASGDLLSPSFASLSAK